MAKQTLTALQSLVAQSLNSVATLPHGLALGVQLVVAGDIRGALLSAVETLKPHVLIMGSTGSSNTGMKKALSGYALPYHSLSLGNNCFRWESFKKQNTHIRITLNRRLLSGSSLTRQIVQSAPCSVLIVRDDEIN